MKISFFKIMFKQKIVRSGNTFQLIVTPRKWYLWFVTIKAVLRIIFKGVINEK